MLIGCILFCKLVEALSGLQAPLGSEVKTRLEWAFSNAESKLGITEIISAEDMTSGYFDERSCLTYLSFFYNKYKHIGKKEEPKKEDDRVPILEARIKELEALSEEQQLTCTALAAACEKKDAMLDKSTNEIQAIIKNTKTLHDELAEQKEINKEISQSIEELQLKLPFLNQKAVKNEIPAPTGNNVSLVVVDVENAESLWNKNANDMALALQGFQSTARRICKKYNGFEAPVEEEKMTFGFSQAPAALSFAVELQQELNDFEWPETFTEGREEFMKGLPAVVALHNGTAAFVEGKYTGPATRVIQRLISAARGGEILTTQHAWSQAVEELPKELVDVIKRNELGSFEVKEINAPIDILQIFPDSLKSRSSLYKEFEFLTPEEKKQSELKEKLEALQADNESLKVKLVATEEQAKKARDRALELNKWLNESRNEMRTTIGEQIQAAMAEVASLIRESETLEKELKRTTQQLNGARKVMDGMNGKMQEMSQKNNLLRSQVVEQERQQQHLSAEITRLEELLNTKKKSFISKLMPGKLKRGSSVADNKKTLEGNADLKKSKVDPKKQSKRATKKMSEEKAEDAEIVVDEKKGKKEDDKKNKKEEEKKRREEEKKRKEEEKKHKKDDKKHKKDEKEEKKDEKKDEKEEKEDEKKDEKEEKEEKEEKSEKSEKKEEDEKRDKVEKD